MPKQGLSVNDVWQLALPTDTLLLAGRAGLARTVDWVALLRATPPLFVDIKPGYIALARVAYLSNLSPHIGQCEFLERLAKVDVSAVVIDEPVDREAVDRAEQLGLPLLLLSESVDPHELERGILRALVDHEGQIALRDAEIGQQLETLYAARGLQAVLEQVAHAVQGEAVLVEPSGNEKLSAGASHSLGEIDAIELPVDVAGRDMGTLVVRRAAARSHPLDPVWARRAASICGIELLQQHTRQETEERLGADLIEQMLEDSLGREALAARLSRLGYRLVADQRHLAIALGPAKGPVDGSTMEQLARDLRWQAQRFHIDVLSLRYRQELLMLASLDRAASEQRVDEWLWEVAGSGATHGLQVGVSRPETRIEGLGQAIRHAMDAWRLGSRISGQRGPHHYADQGLYRLLAGLRDRDEVVRFYRETLGALVRYDQEHGTELVHTLQVFFEHHGNASQTAKALYVHRNTLNYRLQRIAEIGDMDLGDPETRLNAQVALRIHQLS